MIKCLSQFKGNADTAEVAFFVSIVNLPRINHSVSLRKLLGWLVMICNDDINAEIFCICYFFEIRTATVSRDNERCTPGFDLINCFLAQSARIVNTMRDEVIKWSIMMLDCP